MNQLNFKLQNSCSLVSDPLLQSADSAQAQLGVSQLYVSTLTVLEQSPVVKLLYVFYGRDTESSLFASGWWRNE